MPLKSGAELRELPTHGRTFQMISSECPECGEPVPIRAEKCSYCGTPNTARRGVVAIAVAIVLLVIAIASAIYIATRPQTRMAAEPKGASRAVVGEPRGISPPVTADGSFAWIRSALTACDDLAAKQPAELHFIVIPLQAKPSDLPDWQLLTVGTVGNGLSIPADDALGGLRRGTLSIYNEDYVFSVRDANTNVVYKWNSANGVKQFSTKEAEAVRIFRLQSLPQLKGKTGDWGDAFSTQAGKCNWVAAIVRE